MLNKTVILFFNIIIYRDFLQEKNQRPRRMRDAPAKDTAVRAIATRAGLYLFLRAIGKILDLRYKFFS
jgi:hypothetical protein